MNRGLKHFVKALLLGIALVACGALVMITSSLTSMSDLRTRLVDEGGGLLCELGRHSREDSNKPYSPVCRWYVDLSTGNARELSKTDIVSMGMRRPHVFLHSAFRVRQDLVLMQDRSGPGNVANIAIHPVISDGKIKEFELNRENYSLRSNGGGENFRIEWLTTPTWSAIREPTKLLTHAFISEPTDRLISFSSRGLAKIPNIQVRDLKDPDLIIAEWRQLESCLPWCDTETICTLSEQNSIERRSLRTGSFLESIPLNLPGGSNAVINHISLEDHFCIGQGNNGEAKGVVVVDFRTGAQIAFVQDSYALDYAPISKCILLQTLPKPTYTRSLLSIDTRKIVDFEGVKEDDVATLHLSTSESRAIAVMQDGSIRVHSLPDGNLITKIGSMQNCKELYLLVTVITVATWIVCLMVIGRSAGWDESVDILIALGVLWGCLFMLHQRTYISIGLGAMLSSFSLGACSAVAIVLCEWSRHESAQGIIRPVRWSLTIGLLLGILVIEIRDQLLFDACNVREAQLSGFAYVVMCYLAGRGIHAWKRRRFPQSRMEIQKRTQWGIALLLRCMALVAILCTLLTYSSAMDYYSSARTYIDWLWFGKFLLIHTLPIFVGVFCCSVWRTTFLLGGPFATSSSLTERLVLSSTFVFVTASAISTAFLNFRFLDRGVSRWFTLPELDFCVWYSVGFVLVFSILLYRTLPRPSKSDVIFGSE